MLDHIKQGLCRAKTGIRCYVKTQRLIACTLFFVLCAGVFAQNSTEVSGQAATVSSQQATANNGQQAANNGQQAAAVSKQQAAGNGNQATVSSRKVMVNGQMTEIRTQQSKVRTQGTEVKIQNGDTTFTERKDTIVTVRIDTVFGQHKDTIWYERLDSTRKMMYDSAKVDILALKNNLLYDAAATPNLEIEFRLHKHWTLEVGVGFNPFPLNDEKFPKWRHISAWVAPRYWFCNAFNRGFLSGNVGYAHYNVAGDAYPVSWMYPKVKENRYQGDAILFGVSGGWHFAIAPHFSIELEAGVDAGKTWYNVFECKHCGKKTTDERLSAWFALPKVGVNIVVPLGGDKLSFEKRCDCENALEEPEMVVDTMMVLVHDTTVQAPVRDTAYVVVRDTVVEAKGMDTKSEAMQKLRAALFRDDSEYVPYSETMALSSDPRNVFMYFETNVTVLDRSFFDNAKMLDSIAYLVGDALDDPTIEITHIQIVGFASFDGRMSYNKKLASGRAEAMKKYLQERYPELDDSVFAVCNGGESWAELRYLFSQDSFAERDEVLDIIDNEPDYDKREQRIKKMYGGDTYKYIRKQYRKQLRNLGCITVFVKVKGEK